MKRQIIKNDNIIAWQSDNVTYLCFNGKPAIAYNLHDWYVMVVAEAKQLAKERNAMLEELTIGEFFDCEQTLIYNLYKQNENNHNAPTI